MRIPVGKRLILILALLGGAAMAGTVAGADNNDKTERIKNLRQPDPMAHISPALDADGDFLVDKFEEALINTYAPYLIFHPSETAWPSSVEHHLQSSLALRYADKDAPGEFRVPQGGKPSTWADLVDECERRLGQGTMATDMYLALPLDPLAMDPGSSLAGFPADDMKLDARAAAYRARVMIPLSRGVRVRINWFDASGTCFSGECALPLLSGKSVPRSMGPVNVKLEAQSRSVSATVEVSSVHEAMGIGTSAFKKHGPALAPEKLRVKVTVGGNAYTASPIPAHLGPYYWHQRFSPDKAAAGFTLVYGQDLQPDLDMAADVWGTKIPHPRHGARIYAHVYSLARFIVIQYWLFFGYSDDPRNPHTGDWKQVDVVLYRDNPELCDTGAGSASSKRDIIQGVIPAYRNNEFLTRKMIAMVRIHGNGHGIVFRRYSDSDDPKRLERTEPEIGMHQALLPAHFEDPGRKYLLWYRTPEQKTRALKGTHPKIYVARGSHRLYDRGGSHRVASPFIFRLSDLPLCGRKINKNRFKVPYPLFLARKLGVDVCYAGGGMTVTVLPQTSGSAFKGKATYGDKNRTLILDAGKIPCTLVNVGELSYRSRLRIMREDTVIRSTLESAWGFRMPERDKQAEFKAWLKQLASNSTNKKEKLKKYLGKIRNLRKAKNALDKGMSGLKKTVLKVAAKIKKNKDKKNDDKKPAKVSPGLRARALAMARKVALKMKDRLVPIIRKIKKDSNGKVDEKTVQEMIEDKIAEMLGAPRLRPMLLLTRTSPLSGGEFIDYPGRFGRIISSARRGEDAAIQYLGVNPGQDRDLRMATGSLGSGSAGPAAGAPQRYLSEFYRNYDKFCDDYMVYGLTVDL